MAKRNKKSIVRKAIKAALEAEDTEEKDEVEGEDEKD